MRLLALLLLTCLPSIASADFLWPKGDSFLFKLDAVRIETPLGRDRADEANVIRTAGAVVARIDFYNQKESILFTADGEVVLTCFKKKKNEFDCVDTSGVLENTQLTLDQKFTRLRGFELTFQKANSKPTRLGTLRFTLIEE